MRRTKKNRRTRNGSRKRIKKRERGVEEEKENLKE